MNTKRCNLSTYIKKMYVNNLIYIFPGVRSSDNLQSKTIKKKVILDNI